MSNSKRNRNRIQQVKLSDKEITIMREEHDAPQAAKRNVPMFRQMLLTDPELTMMLYDPTLLPMLMAQVIRNLSSKHMLTNKTTQDEEFLQAISQALLPHFNPALILNNLIRIVKERKVKREKRTLLWAVGDLMPSVYQQIPVQRTEVFQTIVTTSVDNATLLTQVADIIRAGKEPYHFNYEDYMEGPIPQGKFEQLNQKLGPQLQSLQRLLSLWAMELFELVKKPFGLPFRDILHYPAAFPKTKSSLIISSPHEKTGAEPDMSDEQKYQKLIQALRIDRAQMTAQEVARTTVRSIKNAAFGEMEPETLNSYLNAATFSLLFPFVDNPFLVRLYEYSGENAGELIEEDEKGDWIEITNDPENPNVYRNYGDTLLQKDDWQGARKAYMRAAELMGESDSVLMSQLMELDQKQREFDEGLIQSAQAERTEQPNLEQASS